VRAITFVWEACGRPPPIETDGTRIVPKGSDATAAACAHCGAPGSRFLVDQAISDKFTTVRNASLLWPHGTERLCAGCVWGFKSLLVRTGMCFARRTDAHGPGGLWPVPLRPIPRPAWLPATEPWPFLRPNTLEVLLCPPPPPFVAWLPLYGIDHGGEAHIHRTYGPDGKGGVHFPADPLWKLQTKHTLPFAKVSHDARRYDLAVDDTNVTVDVALWSRLRGVCEPILAELRAGGVGAEDAKGALRGLRAPRGCPLALATPAVWRARVQPLEPHVGARWWEVFVGLLRMPALVKRERTAR
jgi:hypothetical protein